MSGGTTFEETSIMSIPSTAFIAYDVQQTLKITKSLSLLCDRGFLPEK